MLINCIKFNFFIIIKFFLFSTINSIFSYLKHHFNMIFFIFFVCLVCMDIHNFHKISFCIHCLVFKCRGSLFQIYQLLLLILFDLALEVVVVVFVVTCLTGTVLLSRTMTWTCLNRFPSIRGYR